MEKDFPESMEPLGKREFTFDCHPGVDCFTVCCKKVDMILYPYDVLKLRAALGIDSEDFIRSHTYLEKGQNPFFPTVKLKLNEQSEACPYLKDTGCSVYDDRPSACRTYPLERAVDRSSSRGNSDEYYFLTNHAYCLGHQQEKKWNVQSWVRNQKLIEYNTMNSFWAEMDTLFAKNPWKGEGAGGEKQQIAFMVCYNIDGFRRFSDLHSLTERFRIEKSWKRAIKIDDSELLKFGFEWLKLFLVGESTRLRPR